MQNQSVEQEAKPISTEQEANPNSTEQEVKTKSIEQEANTNLTDQEAKSNSNKQEANSKLAEQGTKSNSTEQETKSNSTEHEIKSNSTEQETKSNLAEQETKFNSIGQETKFNSIGQETINISNSTEQGAKANLTEGISTILWSNSSTTQQLWYKSRLKFVSKFSDLKPPGDLSEQKFVWLLDIGETCQYCGKKIIIGSEERRLFWEFKVLLRESENYSEEVRSCLPCISETIFRNSFNFLVNATSPGYYGTNPYYWKADVSRAVNEYNSLSEVERENWVNEKQIELRNYLEVIEDMRAKENNSSLESFIKQILPM
ncbi:17173_t:CDS:2 [Rhizophagus irregularis]|nr:17173_t:CDS:2 [Rhizophagus irregularis]